MKQKISQREAREMRRELDHLKARLVHGGVRIDTINVNNTELCINATADNLGHIVVARQGQGNQLIMYAVKP